MFAYPVSGSEEFEPPENIEVFDAPNGSGALAVTWDKSPSAGEDTPYLIRVGEQKQGPFYEARKIKPPNAKFEYAMRIFGPFAARRKHKRCVVIRSYHKKAKQIPLENNRTYFVTLSVLTPQGEKKLSPVFSAAPIHNWFDYTLIPHLGITLIFAVLILVMIPFTRRNPNVFIRHLPGLDAIDEALGRATEMGAPAFFVPGIRPINEVPTIAGINILSRVAYRAAELGTDLVVYNMDPVVMAVSGETLREAYLRAGRPDAFQEKNAVFLAAEQFSFAAALSGLMVREPPAANIYMGAFYAESLLLSETGLMSGAIQIAGTDKYTQLPFFITTCDYTLMGEEFYAASAYLSKDPKLLGSLKVQDYMKAGIMAAILLGTALESFDIHVVSDLLNLKGFF